MNTIIRYINEVEVHSKETEESTQYMIKRDDGCRFFFEIKSLWASRQFDKTLAELADLNPRDQICMMQAHKNVERDILFKIVHNY